MNYSNESQFADPSDTPEASYNHHPMDDIEPRDSEEQPGAIAIRIVARVVSILGNLRTEVREELCEAIQIEVSSLRSIKDCSRAVRLLIARILEAEDAQLEAKIIAASVGIPISERTLKEVGVKHGVGRAAVSKRVRAFQKEHSIETACHNKSVSSRAGYRDNNVRRKVSTFETTSSEISKSLAILMKPAGGLN